MNKRVQTSQNLGQKSGDFHNAYDIKTSYTGKNNRNCTCHCEEGEARRGNPPEALQSVGGLPRRSPFGTAPRNDTVFYMLPQNFASVVDKCSVGG
jgi:hypothetical protein